MYRTSNEHETERAALMVRDSPESQALRNGEVTTKGSRRYSASALDKLTLAEVQAEIALLWKDPSNHHNDEIAAIVNERFGLEGEAALTPRRVKHHVSQLIKYWKQAALMSVDDKMAMVQARYAQLERLAEEAFFMSMEGKTVTHMKKQIERASGKEREKWISEQIEHEREELRKNGGKVALFDDEDFKDQLEATSERIETFERHEQGVGDPRFLQQMIQINDRRAELWNLKAHSEVNSKDQEAAKMDDKERDKRLAAVLATAMQRKTGVLPGLATPQPLGGHKQVAEVTTFNEDDLDDIDF